MKVINLENCENIRDICYENIKEKKLIRSSALNKLSDNDVKILKEHLNLKVIIDLRTEEECSEENDIFIEGVKYFNIPLVNKDALGIVQGGSAIEKLMNIKKNIPSMTDLYTKLVSRDKKEMWSEIFDILLNQNEGAILWHCKQGKDRCGIVSAIIEYCLGIDFNTIIDDYLFTNNYFISKREKLYELALEHTNDKIFANDINDLFLAKKEYIMSSFNYINSEYGGIENFLLEICGINDDKLRILKNKYLDI